MAFYASSENIIWKLKTYRIFVTGASSPLCVFPLHSLLKKKGLSNWQNHEYLKYFKNVYCVTTNRSKDQFTGTSHKTTMYKYVSSWLQV